MDITQNIINAQAYTSYGRISLTDMMYPPQGMEMPYTYHRI